MNYRSRSNTVAGLNCLSLDEIVLQALNLVLLNSGWIQYVNLCQKSWAQLFKANDVVS